MRCGRSIADPPDEPAFVGAFREDAARTLGLPRESRKADPQEELEKPRRQDAHDALHVAQLVYRRPMRHDYPSRITSPKGNADVLAPCGVTTHSTRCFSGGVAGKLPKPSVK